MIESKYPTLQEIRESHAPRIEYERYLLVNRFIFRPPAFLAVWVAIRLGISSEVVSWISAVAAFMGFVFLLWPGTPMISLGIIFLMLFNFFDCVDGDIARTMKTRNPYGHFLDSIMSWADMRKRYRPYYSLNENSVWLHGTKICQNANDHLFNRTTPRLGSMVAVR